MMRSDEIKQGYSRAPHRSLLRATGVKDEDFDKPFIGVANSFIEIIPGHFFLNKVSEIIKEEIRANGCVPFEFNTIGVDDGIAMGHDGMLYSLPSREIIANSIETVMNAHKLDAMIAIPNCDKIVPGMIMGALRVDVPTVFVSGGPMAAGHMEDGTPIDLATVFEGVGSFEAGEITADKLSFTAFDISADTLDDITDGSTYGRVLKTDISAGHILLSESIGSLDDIADGTYGKVLKTDISAGHILLSETIQSSGYRTVTDSDIAQWNSSGQPIYVQSTAPSSPDTDDLWLDTSESPHIWKRWDGSAWVLASPEDLDDLEDGTVYSRVRSTDISAGHIKLSETIGTIDDISDGSTYSRVASTDISAGHITLVSSQASLNINNTSFGADGIQLQYNGGNPRAYIGNGSNRYFKFDGTYLSWKGANTELTTSGAFTATNATITGSITITGGSGIGNLSDAGSLATQDSIGASDCDGAGRQIYSQTAVSGHDDGWRARARPPSRPSPSPSPRPARLQPA